MLDVLRAELCRLYPDEASARRLVDEAGLPSIFIDFDGPMVDVWHRIIKQAHARHQLRDLVAVASKEWPTSSALYQVIGGLRYGADVGSAVDIVSPSDDDKLSEIYRMVYAVSERVSVLMVAVIALAVAVGFMALIMVFK